MSDSHYYDQAFKAKKLSGSIGSEFEQCQFVSCDFTEALLKETKFIDCAFENCNLSNVAVLKTSFQECAFTSCKMIGMAFHECNDFNLSIAFDQCSLTHTSFAEMNLTGFSFTACDLTGSDLGYADLSGIRLTDCDLTDALFEQTSLKNSDLRGSYNFRIDPNHNRIKSAKFSKASIHGLLINFGIHIE